ncbi:MAG: glutathione peroxidase [Spirochaetaceae bacterium]|nr:glutathione peroxidase [Spirochaetaceae bacterium]
MGSALYANQASSLYDFTMIDIDGNEVSLSDYEGKAILIVNVASKCGYTYQYEGLEALYEQYKDRGFVILGFPSNDFLGQESGTEDQIKEFCTLTYGVSFPMFSKIKVTGRNKNPLYAYLTDKESNPEFKGRITWNFNKFLVDRNGNIVNRFGSKTEPLSDELIEALEEIL